jgi:hypothetical protein
VTLHIVPFELFPSGRIYQAGLAAIEGEGGTARLVHRRSESQRCEYMAARFGLPPSIYDGEVATLANNFGVPVPR